jgi:FtsZ-interacting cell division protein YlmF
MPGDPVKEDEESTPSLDSPPGGGQSTTQDNDNNDKKRRTEIDNQQRDNAAKKKRSEEEQRQREEAARKKQEEEAANRRKNSREAVAQQFNQEVVGNLQKKHPNLQTEKLPVETPNKYKISIPNCITSKRQDTYITVGIFYPQFKSANPYDEPKYEAFFKVSGNAKDSSFINNLKYSAYESLQTKVSNRLSAIPEDQRYSVPRLFTTDFVYAAKNCTN